MLDGYYDCNDSNIQELNGKFCHLVNPNWVLKAPDYKCESGSVYSNLLTATQNSSDTNIRYEYCPDVSSCVSEDENGVCNTFGYCMREKNVWRFGVSADKCNKESIGCTKYTYTMNKTSNEIGLIKGSADSSSCDETNSGCRKYSLEKTGDADKDWDSSDAAKIYLNSNVGTCDFSEEGCTSFIRRDAANLIKNSSFEEYTIPDLNDSTIKIAELFSGYGYSQSGDDFEKVYVDNVKVLDGNWSLYMSRSMSDPDNDFVSYKIDSVDNLIDVEPNKTYTLSYYVTGSLPSGVVSNSVVNNYGYGIFVNIKEYKSDKTRVTNTPYNYIDMESFRYVNEEITSSWVRKKITFKTSNNAEYIDVLPMISNINGYAYFDALQLEEGNNLTTYKLYEDSSKNYLKKAPDYMNCYNSTTLDDSSSCIRFAKGCDAKDAGCRKYTKTDDTDFWLPGKPSENNVCYSECKGYELYKELGPSYNKESGATFKSLISSTATTCNAEAAGCSKYINLDAKTDEYFSTIKSCVREDSLGYGYGTTAKEFADYFTYAGSEVSGFRMNVYRLLRSKYCEGTSTKCITSAIGCNCLYSSDDNKFEPTTKQADAVVATTCDETAYQSSTRDPNCREFHGPKNEQEAKNPNEVSSQYVLYYANMTETIPVSNDDCKYYEIGLTDSYLSKSLCNTVSFLPANVDPTSTVRGDVGRYKYDDGVSGKICLEGDFDKIGDTCTSGTVTTDCGSGGVCDYKVLTCNIGVYIPESDACSSDQNGCREYKGTSSITETIFYDNIEKDNTYDWEILDTNSTVDAVNLSRESIFVNESSVKLSNKNETSYGITKDLTSYVESDTNTVSLYKVSLYAKNNSTTGENSQITVQVGSKSITKTINNDWKFITFSVYDSLNMTNNKIINVKNISSTNEVYVDYIKFEKSQSEYLIKDTWNTPVSCDNDYENPQGTCTQTYATLGYCELDPAKICLTGNNLGATCTTEDKATTCGSSDDVCDYPNKYCSSTTDNSGASCEIDDDCYNSGSTVVSGTCTTSTNGYRLNLGKMIGCDEYSDPYNNNGFYVFNDLNLCSADKMGCEAVYDTHNSATYKKQEFNRVSNVSDLIAYYEFDDENSLGKDSSGNNNNIVIPTTGMAYSSDAVFSGALNINESYGSVANDNFDSALTTKSQFLTLSSWVKPKYGNGLIVKRDNSFSLSFSGAGENITTVKCEVGYGSLGTEKTDITYTASPVMIKNTWNHIVCTYDGGRLRLYINGKTVKIGDYKPMKIGYDDGTNITIGSSTNDYGQVLDDLRIYRKVLEPTDVVSLYNDYKDNIVVPADDLKYIIIDPAYSCDSKYKGCTALGRREDRYDAFGDYGPVYYTVDPDKFGSYASSTAINSGNLCKAEEEGCYTFYNGTSKENFKFPKNLCVYKESVDIGYGGLFKTGWFKYNYQTSSVTNEGCYLSEVNKIYNNPDFSKGSETSYKLYDSSQCEYKEEVVRRDVVNKNWGTVGNPKNGYGVYPRFAYYKYNGDERINERCTDAEIDNQANNCKPYGYRESFGIIDEIDNTTHQFKICKYDAANAGASCNSNSDCGGGSCVAPYIVKGWFKTGTTEGCSDNGDNIISDTDYKKIYNGSVGTCSEYGCIEFIEPSDRKCSAGNKNGYTCQSDNDCGAQGSCDEDILTGNKYCNFGNASYGINNNANECGSDSVCGFGGKCTSNNNYTYINNSKIDKTSCTTVSRQEGCVLFNDTSNTTLKYASQYSYIKANQNGGRGVSPEVGDDSGGVRQKDSNTIIKVTRDRDCYEWLTFGTGDVSTRKFTLDIVKGDNLNTCVGLKSDGTCQTSGSGWDDPLDSKEYIKDMTGEWSNNDFSGLSIYNQKSIDKGDWWKLPFTDGNTRNILGTDTITQGTYSYGGQSGYGDNLICKKYPEKDSPFNYTDKYETEAIIGNEYTYGFGYCSGVIYTPSSTPNCETACKYGDNKNGICISAGSNNFKCCILANAVVNNTSYGLPFDVYKNKSLRTYFKAANSGLSVMNHNSGSWLETNPIRYIISDMQECYYQRAKYSGLYQDQFYQVDSSLKPFDEVCEERGETDNAINSKYKCYSSGNPETYSKNSKLKEVIDYSKTNKESDYRQGYCLEYDYSKEIYYDGSGKYNCINWVPGFTE